MERSFSKVLPRSALAPPPVIVLSSSSTQGLTLPTKTPDPSSESASKENHHWNGAYVIVSKAKGRVVDLELSLHVATA